MNEIDKNKVLSGQKPSMNNKKQGSNGTANKTAEEIDLALIKVKLHATYAGKKDTHKEIAGKTITIGIITTEAEEVEIEGSIITTE